MITTDSEAAGESKRKVQLPTDLVVLPDKESARSRIATIGAGSAMAAVALGVGVFLLVFGESVDFARNLAFSLVLTSLGLAISLRAWHEKIPMVVDGKIFPGFRFQRRDGTKVRFASMSEIVDVEPTVSRTGHNAVSLSLGDGTRILVFQESFGPRGFEVMRRLSESYGRSFQEETKKILISGHGGAGFREVSVVRAVDDSVVLRRSLATYSGRSLSRVPWGDVESTETVVTPYAGRSLLVTLKDGTSFLIPNADARRITVERAPGWETAFRRHLQESERWSA